MRKYTEYLPHPRRVAARPYLQGINMESPCLESTHLEISTPSAGGSGGLNPFGVQFAPEEEEEFRQMARSDGFYERFAKSVGPSIYGSLGMLLVQDPAPLLEFTTPAVFSRYQEGNHMFTLWWFEESPSRWHEAKRRHQRSALGRPRYCKESATQIRRKGSLLVPCTCHLPY